MERELHSAVQTTYAKINKSLQPVLQPTRKEKKVFSNGLEIKMNQKLAFVDKQDINIHLHYRFSFAYLGRRFCVNSL